MTKTLIRDWSKKLHSKYSGCRNCNYKSGGTTQYTYTMKKLLAAANFSYNICNFKLQILQLYKLFILKIFAAIFAPFRCILEEEISINLLGSNS